MRGGPPITVRCDCGQARPLAYGEVWNCACGKRWNTMQIPAEEYGRVAREVSRYRAVVIAVSVLIVGVLIPLGVLVSFRFFILMPILLGVWVGFVAPFLRRRMGRKLGRLPSWQLSPE